MSTYHELVCPERREILDLGKYVVEQVFATPDSQHGQLFYLGNLSDLAPFCPCWLAQAIRLWGRAGQVYLSSDCGGACDAASSLLPDYKVIQPDEET